MHPLLVTAKIWRPIFAAASSNLLSPTSTPLEKKAGADLCEVLGRCCGAYGMTEALEGIVCGLASFTGLLGAWPSNEIAKTSWLESSADVWSIPIGPSPAILNPDDMWGDRTDLNAGFTSQKGQEFGENGQ